MIAFLVILLILFIVLIVGCGVVAYYAPAVPVLAEVLKGLIGACVVVGVVLVLFIAIEIYNEVKKK